MTDHDDLDPLDELASNHLDGRTTAAEAARIAGDAELQARVDAMAAVRDALRAPVHVDDLDRDRAIAAALSAFDDDGAVAPPVADLREVAARRRLPSRTMRVVGIAAAAVALALAVPVLSALDGGDADEEASSADEAAEEAASAEEASGLDAADRAVDDDLARDGAEAAPAAPSADAEGVTGSQSYSTAEAADAGWLGEFT